MHEDAGLMPHQEGVRQRSLVRYKAQGSTANSMAGSGEATPVGDWVSTWMGGCSQGPSILENCCGPGHVTPTCSIVSRPTRERERERNTGQNSSYALCYYTLDADETLRETEISCQELDNFNQQKEGSLI